MFTWLRKRVAFTGIATLPIAEKSAPDCAHYKTRGDAFLADGKPEEAAQCYQLALSIDPADGGAYRNLGFIYNELARSAEAERSARQALTLNANLPDAHYLLGIIAQARRDLDAAGMHLRKVLELAPDFEIAYRDLCYLLFQRGQAEQAKQVIIMGITHNPGCADLHFYLGNLYHETQQADLAIASFQTALALNPTLGAAYNHLGHALQARRKFDEAATSYRHALAIRPQLIDAAMNLGNALHELGRLDDAVASYRHALEIDPNLAAVHIDLGNALKTLGQPDSAIECYRRALAIKPDSEIAYSNLGIALADLGQLDRAATNYRVALEMRPDFAEAYCNLGSTQRHLGQVGDAAISFRRALEIKPSLAEAHNNLGNALTDLGQLESAVACYQRALEINPDFSAAHSSLLFIYNFMPDRPAEMLLAEARRFGDRVTQRARAYTSWPNLPDPGRRLRIGLVSGDFGNHPVTYYVESILAALATETDRLEFIAYANRFSSDAVTARIKSYCREWHSAVGLSDERLACKIRDDGIDVLIDLSGHTALNRLPMLAWKPAPVQASWLGYFPTTGIGAVDYVIADRWVPPPQAEILYTEKIQRLPETYACFTPPDANLQVGPLPALAAGHITFGSFNNLIKMNDGVVALWSRVLRAIPGSRLLLKTRQLTAAITQQTTIERFAAHGVAANRLILEGQSPRHELLAAYRRVDIALDPFPFPGGTTSVETLWMGVPLLTLAGDRYLSHIGVSILKNAGLADWAAFSADEYVALAVSHTGNLDRLARLRGELRQQVLTSPLFDAPRFAAHFETAIREMWTEWCNRQ